MMWCEHRGKEEPARRLWCPHLTSSAPSVIAVSVSPSVSVPPCLLPRSSGLGRECECHTRRRSVLWTLAGTTMARLPPDHARGCTTGVPPMDPQPEAQGVSSRYEQEGRVALHPAWASARQPWGSCCGNFRPRSSSLDLPGEGGRQLCEQHGLTPAGSSQSWPFACFKNILLQFPCSCLRGTSMTL